MNLAKSMSKFNIIVWGGHGSHYTMETTVVVMALRGGECECWSCPEGLALWPAGAATVGVLLILGVQALLSDSLACLPHWDSAQGLQWIVHPGCGLPVSRPKWTLLIIINYSVCNILSESDSKVRKHLWFPPWNRTDPMTYRLCSVSTASTFFQERWTVPETQSCPRWFSQSWLDVLCPRTSLNRKLPCRDSVPPKVQSQLWRSWPWYNGSQTNSSSITIYFHQIR